jgi:hypothetical protein
MCSVAAGGEILAHAVAQARRTGGDIATVNGDLRTTDEARLIRCEEQHQIGAFPWGPWRCSDIATRAAWAKASLPLRKKPVSAICPGYIELTRMFHGENCRTAVLSGREAPIC